MHLWRNLGALLTTLALVLTLSACSTKPTVTVSRTIVLAPPTELLTECTPVRVKDDTVAALAEGYIKNTYEVWRCDSRIKAIKKWSEEQGKLYNGQ